MLLLLLSLALFEWDVYDEMRWDEERGGEGRSSGGDKERERDGRLTFSSSLLHSESFFSGLFWALAVHTYTLLILGL
jgi:hypothetical protein